ncbi:3-ketoacyl-ACP reductase [Oscillibacter sp.]|uniref:3-ketoacyl-ACP reductase n=1 Tax=Oscillibacter sp. TaxID=1945593 RepID=UPI0026078BB3|nr:3-ketoacyl-ACP reductase [Oscillibacter sp.]MDD3347858.1 3-ketoacyl-ACP reductase [Oscillibacter sp.]
MHKKAMVTGGGRGIGLGVVRELVAAGYDVAITGSSPAEHYAATLEELQKSGSEIFYLQGDLANTCESRHCVEEAVKRLGRIDVLVNNAGVAPKVRADLLEMTEESFDRVVGTNTRGTMFLTQAVAKQMLGQEAEDGARGSIINISSISATVTSVNRGEYCVSKAGVSMLTQLYADRLAPEQIFVYEIRPGVIQTDMTTAVREKYDAMFAGGGCPIARWGLPQDIGRAAAALCTNSFRYTTGQVIFVDGGMHIQKL